ncbi:hypothetical protein F4553_006503 [Allocatelliglobosispora scoriae]|uniref:Uncharacterized protein n=1 Tax=Allocatelliglobosispora scoriae TaxID=643052 RepID=A0A841C155_9ACTN|nr:hypothetical protein [Allocatelliglobosispora scoriae]MBB5873069.1 hypothetical protein [Allocatelliglobosispora scoriae]
MSWSILATPLHSVQPDVLEWAASASASFGVPGQLPPPHPLPVVAEVLTAFRKAGCHGTPWFRVDGLGAGFELASGGGLDLGEVTLQAPDWEDQEAPLTPESEVGSVGFRDPESTAALYAICALAQIAGAMLVFDTDCERVIVVWPGDSPVSLAEHWPW